MESRLWDPSSASEVEAHKMHTWLSLGCRIGLGVTPAAEARRVFLRQLKATFSLVRPQQGPPVAEMMVSLGPKEVRERIQKVLCS